MAIWHFLPDWSTNVQVTYEFMTEIITSRAGKEQRIAKRDDPRLMIEYSTTVADRDLRATLGLLAADQDTMTLMADWVQPMSLAAAVSAGSTLVIVEDAEGWMRSTTGIIFVWEEDGRTRSANSVISSRSGNNVTLTLSMPTDIPLHAHAYRMWTGHLNTSIGGSFAGDRMAEVKVIFDVDPGFENFAAIPAAPETYGGYELLSLEPDWSRPFDAEFIGNLEVLDYGFGRKAFTRPVAFNSRLMKFGYMLDGRDEVDYFVNLFCRMSGQQGEFRMPTFTEDLSLRSAASSGDTQIRVIGSDVAANFGSSTIYDAIVIFLMDGTRIMRTVSSMTPTGDDTLIDLTSTMPTVALDDVDRISWMPVWRFASDQLVVQWETDQSAIVSLSLMTLESLAPES